MNAKISVFVICVELIIYLLLYNLHDCTFKFKYYAYLSLQSSAGYDHISDVPTGIYLLNVNYRNTRTRCEICLKFIIKTPERRQ